jgi:hypothetical protein
MCGRAGYPFPYTDSASVGAPICPGVMEAYVTGVSRGTSPSTFSPDNTVIRMQMTTFLRRSLDQGLARPIKRNTWHAWQHRGSDSDATQRHIGLESATE